MSSQNQLLVTGCAGFIGYHLTKRLLHQGYSIIGIDNLTPYYDVSLKKDRLKQLLPHENFTYQQISIEDGSKIKHIFSENEFESVIHLAAQPGVRYSFENPQAYIDTNITGFLSILEACRYHQPKQLIFASSSSVYGANTEMPFSEEHRVDHPLSLYGMTKKSNELMAYTYTSQFGTPTIGLRFFTVYGPWGRPDMALFSFTKSILSGKTIKVYNHGNMKRDFTYVDDIIEGIVRLIEKDNNIGDKNKKLTQPVTNTNDLPYRIYNIGNQNPVNLLEFIEVLEKKLGIQANKELLPMQAGDLSETYADVDMLVKDVDYKPNTTIKEGISRFVDWYLEYYNKKK
ncbi:NAD-dependent epimerase/dehydratase family protein [Chengkuizengella marina]|uniref:NAD-dependent epimerase/dehydratase family protein n=1 Tax=Chengkuizengella marina TaxID=2507566 RepID=A0A6N9Q3D4_9BACL|nr:NAD-dependent epimerase/dehydratase family protein [Chengkuizengella marina]NBI29308.1 NAD-dependent epimerase/dehydratase family protein [Chengkuizengella marina]